MAARGEQGLERVRVKLEQCLKDRDFYHAHQMYRTLYFRWDEIHFLPVGWRFIIAVIGNIMT